MFQSSLAVQFTSRKRGGWSPDRLSEETKAEIISALEARTTIIRRFSQIRSALFDFVEVAGQQFGLSDSEKFDAARSLVGADALLSPNAPEVCALIDTVEELSEKLSCLVHGFVEVREERSGEMSYRFTLGRSGHVFTCAELRGAAVDLDLIWADIRRRLDILQATVKSP